VHASQIQSEEPIDEYKHVVVSNKVECFEALVCESHIRGKGEAIVFAAIIIAKTFAIDWVKLLVVVLVDETVAGIFIADL